MPPEETTINATGLRVQRLDEHGHAVGDPVTLNVDTATITTSAGLRAQDVVEGTHYLLIGNPWTTLNPGRGGVHFGNTEPIEVVANGRRNGLGDVNVAGLNNAGASITQWVDAACLRPMPTTPSDLTVADLVEGREYMLDPNAKCDESDRGEVFYGNAEPIAVRYTGRRQGPNVQVTPINYPAYPSMQWVLPKYLRRIVEPLTPGGPLPVGTRLRITDTRGGHGFPLGSHVYVGTPTPGVRAHMRSSHTFVTWDRGMIDVPRPVARGSHGLVRLVTAGGWPPSAVLDPEVPAATPAAAPVVTSRTRDSIEIGDVFTITGTDGGHGFAVGTEVRAAARPGHGSVSRGNDAVYVTSGTDLWCPLPEPGVTAWVRAFGGGRAMTFVRPNTEGVPEGIDRVGDDPRAGEIWESVGHHPYGTTLTDGERVRICEANPLRNRYGIVRESSGSVYSTYTMHREHLRPVAGTDTGEALVVVPDPRAGLREQHGTVPEWPVERCHVDNHADRPHYHITYAQFAQAEYGYSSTEVMTGQQVYYDNSYNTVPDKRFAKGIHMPHEPHGATPEWDIEACTFEDHSGGIHYHATDPSVDVTLGFPKCHESGIIRTEQGKRFAKTVPSSGQELPPPEEVLRIIERDGTFPTEAGQIRALIAEVTEARSAVSAAREERAQWLASMIERSRIVANRESWCGVYDQGMRELGLPDRHGWTPGAPMPSDDDDEDEEVRTETVTVTAGVEVTVPFDEDNFSDWFRTHITESDINSVDTQTEEFTVNISLSQDFEVDEDACGCNEDRSMWSDYLPSWVTDHGYSWSILETECRND